MSGTMTHTGRRSRATIAVATILGLLVLAGAWWLLFGERAFGTAADGATDVLAQEADEDEDADEAELGEPLELAVTYDFFLARDPFESIRPPAPVTPDPTNDNNDNNDTAPPPDNDNGLCVVGVEAVCNGMVVALQDVVNGVAEVNVDGVTYEVEPGETFATNFQLIRIDGTCIDVLFMSGDEAEVFRLCLDADVAK